MHSILTNWLSLGDCWYKYIEYDPGLGSRDGKIVAFISKNEEDGSRYDVFIWPNCINASDEDIEWSEVDNPPSKKKSKYLILKRNPNIQTAFLKGNIKTFRARLFYQRYNKVELRTK